MKILLVDNSEDYRRSLAKFLKQEDYEVVEAGSVEEAMERLEATTVDLAVVDLRLIDDENPNDISGFEVAKKARELRIPRIIITACPTIQTAREALRTIGGEPIAYDFVSKADGPRVILAAIVELVRMRDLGWPVYARGTLGSLTCGNCGSENLREIKKEPVYSGGLSDSGEFPAPVRHHVGDDYVLACEDCGVTNIYVDQWMFID